MGVNISIYDATTGREIPDWDSGRMGGDRQLASIIPALPHDFRNGLRNECTMPPDYEPFYRPSDFAAWRLKAAELDPNIHNAGRFEKLIDLLEQHPTCWVYIGW